MHVRTYVRTYVHTLKSHVHYTLVGSFMIFPEAAASALAAGASAGGGARGFAVARRAVHRKQGVCLGGYVGIYLEVHRGTLRRTHIIYLHLYPY